MDDKRWRAWRTMTQDSSGPIAEVCRRGTLLRERQFDWNGLLALEAQGQTWLVDWSGGGAERTLSEPGMDFLAAKK